MAKAAGLLCRDRQATGHGQPRPGQAEYLDLLRAVVGLGDDLVEQMRMLGIVAEFTLKKHAGSGMAT